MKTVLTLAALAAVASSFAVDYTGTGGNILDGSSTSPVTTTFTISGASTLASINSITLTGLTHTWVGDLTAVLTSPTGNSMTLFQKINSGTTTGTGESSTFAAGTYVFAVGGGSIWTAGNAVGFGVAIAPGTYEPSANLFTGTIATSYAPTNYAGLTNSSAGAWKLAFTDNDGGDSGSFTSWTLSGTPQAVPEPSTVAALGLGAIALLRRRKKA